MTDYDRHPTVRELIEAQIERNLFEQEMCKRRYELEMKKREREENWKLTLV